MDLILLKPGNPALFGPKGDAQGELGGCLVPDKGYPLLPADLGECIELVSIH